MFRKLLEQIKDFLHKQKFQENIINVLTFVRNVIAEYAILMILQDILKLV